MGLCDVFSIAVKPLAGLPFADLYWQINGQSGSSFSEAFDYSSFFALSAFLVIKARPVPRRNVRRR